MTQSGHLTQNPPNIRPNIPGAGAGDGRGASRRNMSPWTVRRPGALGHRGRRWRRTGIPARNDSRDRRRRASSGRTPPRQAPPATRRRRLRPRPKDPGGLESLYNRLGVARGSRKSGLEVHAHELDAGRSAERDRRLAGKGDLENSRTTGAETLPPVSPCPMGDGLSKPIYTPTTRSGVKPMNQPSFSSLVVPVLPAMGRSSTLSFCAVPRWTTPSMIETI